MVNELKVFSLSMGLEEHDERYTCHIRAVVHNKQLFLKHPEFAAILNEVTALLGRRMASEFGSADTELIEAKGQLPYDGPMGELVTELTKNKQADD